MAERSPGGYDPSSSSTGFKHCSRQLRRRTRRPAQKPVAATNYSHVGQPRAPGENHQHPARRPRRSRLKIINSAKVHTYRGEFVCDAQRCVASIQQRCWRSCSGVTESTRSCGAASMALADHARRTPALLRRFPWMALGPCTSCTSIGGGTEPPREDTARMVTPPDQPTRSRLPDSCAPSSTSSATRTASSPPPRPPRHRLVRRCRDRVEGGYALRRISQLMIWPDPGPGWSPVRSIIFSVSPITLYAPDELRSLGPLLNVRRPLAME
jgi:hypothetical protein